MIMPSGALQLVMYIFLNSFHPVSFTFPKVYYPMDEGGTCYQKAGELNQKMPLVRRHHRLGKFPFAMWDCREALNIHI